MQRRQEKESSNKKVEISGHFFLQMCCYFFYAFHASIAHVHFGHISSLNELVLASVGLYLGLILCNSRKKKELILFAKPESEKIHDFANFIC